MRQLTPRRKIRQLKRRRPSSHLEACLVQVLASGSRRALLADSTSAKTRKHSPSQAPHKRMRKPLMQRRFKPSQRYNRALFSAHKTILSQKIHSVKKTVDRIRISRRHSNLDLVAVAVSSGKIQCLHRMLIRMLFMLLPKTPIPKINKRIQTRRKNQLKMQIKSLSNSNLWHNLQFLDKE